MENLGTNRAPARVTDHEDPPRRRGINPERLKVLLEKDDLTEAEQQELAKGMRDVGELFNRACDAVKPMLVAMATAIAESVTRVCRQAQQRSALPTVRADVEWPEPHETSGDAMVVSYEGLPGLASRCWADVWEPFPYACDPIDCLDPCGEHGTYAVCNGDVVDALGLCAEHTMTAESA